jgi:hypothetical protein
MKNGFPYNIQLILHNLCYTSFDIFFHDGCVTHIVYNIILKLNEMQLERRAIKNSDFAKACEISFRFHLPA